MRWTLTIVLLVASCGESGPKKPCPEGAWLEEGSKKELKQKCVKKMPGGEQVYHGTATWWYQHGQKKEEREYVEDEVQRWRTWHENGRLEYDIRFKNKAAVLPYKEFYNNGQVRRETIRLESGEVECREWDPEGKRTGVARYAAGIELWSPLWHQLSTRKYLLYDAWYKGGKLDYERWFFGSWQQYVQHGDQGVVGASASGAHDTTLDVYCGESKLWGLVVVNVSVPEKKEVAAQLDSETVVLSPNKRGNLQVPESALPALKRGSKLKLELASDKGPLAVEFDLAGADKAIAKVEKACAK